MKDSLKKFVAEHRQEFDHRDPSPNAWTRIKSNLPGKQVSLWNNVVVWRVAAVLFLGLSVYFFNTRDLSRTSRESAQLQGEFSDLESFYSEQIEEKVELISHIQNFSEEEQFTQDLEKLEAMYLVLREQMKSHPSEKVKDALILNLLVRIDLLNQQIESIEDSKKVKTETEESSV
ncbi:MAG: hypothetical protein ABL895_04415 [Cyclobacteriaceae bacterium]